MPVYNGLTDEFHPTQVLAGLLTMGEHCDRPLSQITFCFVGDTGSNMGDSLMIGGVKMGMDVRLCGPKPLWPKAELVEEAKTIAKQTGARLTLTEDILTGVRETDFVYTDVWVSMGQPEDVWSKRIEALLPYQVNAAMMKKTVYPDTKFMHCLPAFHNSDTEVGARIAQSHVLDALEVTDEIFESPASIVFDQAENRMHTIKAVLVPHWAVEMLVVVALGGNALLRSGEEMTAAAQQRNVERAAKYLAEIVRAGHELVVTLGNAPQIGLLAMQANPWPLDILGAQTDGMIGYVIERALENALLHDRPVVTLLTQVVVDGDDPAFGNPTKFVGPVWSRAEAEEIAGPRGLSIAEDGTHWRRAVSVAARNT